MNDIQSCYLLLIHIENYRSTRDKYCYFVCDIQYKPAIKISKLNRN